MRNEVKLEGFAADTWPDRAVIDKLRLEEGIRVHREGTHKQIFVATADVGDPAAVLDAAHRVYARLKSLNLLHKQPGERTSLINAQWRDERGQTHLLPVDAIVAQGNR